jgi:hypothetical protein
VSLPGPLSNMSLPVFCHASSSLPPSVPPVVTSKHAAGILRFQDGVALVLFGLIVLIAPGARALGLG